MKKRILVLGGYGGVGRPLVEALASQAWGPVTIAGRDGEKAEAFKQNVLQRHPEADLSAIALDAYDFSGMIDAFRETDLVIVTATVPERMCCIARAALAAQVDLIDIMHCNDVAANMRTYQEDAENYGLRFVTQAGFHPGMMAPLVKWINSRVDQLDDIRIHLAMEAAMESPESVHEILENIIKDDAKVYLNDHWKHADHHDARTTNFPAPFGERKCYPMNMPELEGLEEDMPLRQIGVYACGFDRFTDHFVFPLTSMLGRISDRMATQVGGQLFYQHFRNRKDIPPKVAIVAEGDAVVAEEQVPFRVTLAHHNGYELTAMCVMGLLDQYLNAPGFAPGVHLMGQVVDPNWLFDFLQANGLQMDVSGLPEEVTDLEYSV